MSKKLGIRFGLLVWLSMLTAGTGLAQEFTKSLGMVYFNRAKYDSAATEIKNWITQYPESQDIATYYLAECYYNLGMDEPQAGKSRESFRKAYTAFQEVLKYTSLKDRYPKIYYSAQLKKGWCYFRRAETGEQPPVQLDLAFNNFIAVEKQAPDSIQVQADFMAGESRFLEGYLRKFDALIITNSQMDFNKIITVLNEALVYYNKVLANPKASAVMKLTADIRKNDIDFELGKIYQVCPETLFGQLNDNQKKNTATETALSRLRQVHYADLLNRYPDFQRSPYRDFLYYAEAMKWLNIYFITFQYEDKQQILSALAKVQLNELEKETKFRLGNADHNTTQLDDNENFFNLYQNDNRSDYFAALPTGAALDIGEAYFWLGTVQFIANQNAGIDNLNSFIQRFQSRSDNPRLIALLDYARYWRGMLYLEAYRNDRARLLELKRYLTEFKPTMPGLTLQCDLLKKLVQLELGDDVWRDILNSGNSPEWFKDAVQIIQYLLRRAAMVVSVNRQHYLDQLNKIFYYTSFQKSNETVFYQGIAKSLEAEIQGDEDVKIRMFQESARLLATVEEPYKNEADYIRARSLFFAKNYNDAKKVLRYLINEKHSLRSLYYFAEVLRQSGQGNAAKDCYEVIKQKTQTNPDGKFWFYNSEAAINMCLNRVDGSGELNGLDYANVIFPDRLLDQVANSYEQLADRQFVRFQYLQESLMLLKKYVLPKKMVYVASVAPLNSIFKQDAIAAVPPILNELLRRETSIIDIFVLLQESPTSAFDVQINNQAARQIASDHFQSTLLSVGDHVTISIRQNDYYNYQSEFDIITPGKQEIVVPLAERVSFRPALPSGMPLTYLAFPKRLDHNVIIQQRDFKIPADSQLLRDLNSSLQLRDVVFDPKLQSFLAVDFKQLRALRRYDQTGSQSESDPLLPLQFGNYDLQQLQEPEGITLDFDGNIYITDFAAHRVVVFDSLGRYLRYFGGYGKNNPEQSAAAHFVFPTRITIEQDLQGFDATMNGEKTRVFCHPFLLIADRYGVHRCDLQGNYIETVIEPNTTELPPGEIYALGIQNYGRNAKMYVGVRKEANRVLSYSARAMR